MKRMRVRVCSGVAFAAALTMVACGGGDDGPTTPTNPGGTGGPIAATITIGSDGRIANPNVTVAVGSRVTFTNNHNRVHDMSSDPHPAHTDCSQLGTVGNIAAGQSKTTENLTVARRCGFHDHLDPENSGLQGSITIQ